MHSFCFLINLFIFGCTGVFSAELMLSLAVESGGYSLVVERRPLIAVASLAVERGL